MKAIDFTNSIVDFSNLSDDDIALVNSFFEADEYDNQVEKCEMDAHFFVVKKMTIEQFNELYGKPNDLRMVNESEEPKPVKAEPYWRKFEKRGKYK